MARYDNGKYMTKCNECNAHFALEDIEIKLFDGVYICGHHICPKCNSYITAIDHDGNMVLTKEDDTNMWEIDVTQLYSKIQENPYGTVCIIDNLRRV